MKVRDLPPRLLLVVDPGTSLAEVASRMRRDDSDSVVVMTEGRLLGIITERDLVGVIADGIDPRKAKATVLMSAHPVVARLEGQEELELLAPLEPVPLYHVLGARGFSHETESLGKGDYRVVFRREVD